MARITLAMDALGNYTDVQASKMRVLWHKDMDLSTFQ